VLGLQVEYRWLDSMESKGSNKKLGAMKDSNNNGIASRKKLNAIEDSISNKKLSAVKSDRIRNERLSAVKRNRKVLNNTPNAL